MNESQVILSRLTDALENPAAPSSRRKTSTSSAAGSFTCRSSLPVTALALSVDATGPMRLPLSMTRARKLSSLATPAPFGKGRQTLHDKRVRDVGEITRRRLDWNGRDWHRSLKPVLEEMRAELGLPDGKLTAKVDKLLVYGPGQFFKPHRDTERADDMIGTLVVVLPSPHKGGSLIVTHEGESRRFITRESASPNLALYAFYADCEHEVRPVIEGYRVVLSHTLHFKAAASRAATAATENPRIDQALNDYFDEARFRENSWRRRDNKLVYLLDHAYSQRSLNWNHLKGKDSQRAAALLAAASRLDLQAHLSVVSVTEIASVYPTNQQTRYYDYWDYEDEDEDVDDDIDPSSFEIQEIIDCHASLKHWRDAAGKKADLPELTAFDQELCWNVGLDQHTPTFEEYEGYMGNYGNTLEREYRRAAIVLWPARERYGILATSDGGGPLVIRELLRDADALDSQQLTAAVKSFLTVWPGRDRHKDASSVTDMLALASKLPSDELALDLLHSLSISSLTRKTTSALIASTNERGEDFCLALLERWLADSVTTERTRSKTAFGRLFSEQADSHRLDWLKQLQYFIRTWSKSAQSNSQKLPCAVVDRMLRLLREEHARLHQSRSPSLLSRNAVREQRDLLFMLDALAELDNDAHWLKLIGIVDNMFEDYASDVLVAALEKAGGLNLNKPVATALESLRVRTHELIRDRMENATRLPGDWRLTIETGCRCADCATLNDFLKSASEAISLPLAKERRRHLHGKIDGLELPVDHRTRRQGSPYVLVLRKQRKLFTDAKKLVESERSAAMRRAALQTFLP